jgi:hypothetical protein
MAAEKGKKKHDTALMDEQDLKVPDRSPGNDT